MHARASRRSKRVQAKPYEDGHRKKRYPLGLAETIAAISQYWNAARRQNGANQVAVEAVSEKEAVKEFARDPRLLAIYAALRETYPGAAEWTVNEDSGLYALVHALAKGEKPIDFLRLRLFADYVGLPTGLLLIFSQCVSDERRERNPADVIHRSIRALRYLESRLDNSEVQKQSLRVEYGDGNSLPDIAILKELSEIYNDSAT